jgi:preprotein translocase subunit SecD
MSGNTFRWAMVIAVVCVGLFALMPSFMDASDGKLDREIPQALREGWGKVFLDRVDPLTLGLDLQGGLLLQYNVLVDKAVQDKLERMARDIEKRLVSKEPGLKVKVTHNEGDNFLDVTFEDGAKLALVDDTFMGAFTNMTRNQIAPRTLRLEMQAAYIEETKEFAVQQAIQTIRQRVDALGVAEPSISRRGASDIVVQLPGLKEKDVERAKKLIGQTAMLEFRMVDDAGSNNFFSQFRGGKLPKGFALRRVDGGYLSVTHKDKEQLKRFLTPKLDDSHVLGFEYHPIYKNLEKTQLDEERSYWKTYYIFKKVELTGDYIQDARVQLDQQFNKPYVGITFDGEGGELFGQLSSNNVGKRMAIMLDDNVKSAPVFQEAILGGSARISMGSMQSFQEMQNEAQDLVIVLRHGALPAPIEKQFETVVGPSLGQDSINSSVKAFMLGSLLVVIFMSIYYRVSGVIAVIAVLLNVFLMIASLALIGATLTLPGIAGIILTVGMAVDANIIIYERMREELRRGKKAREAVSLGFDKALSAVLDSNITTGIAGLVLLQFGTGPIKGFAVTLLIGIVATVFTAVIVARLMFDTWIQGERGQRSELSI